MTDYFPSIAKHSGRRLGDALGSVRQLTDLSGQVTLAKGYTPYGETRSSLGSGTSAFAFTGEQTDPTQQVDVPAGVSHALRPAKYASKAVKATDFRVFQKLGSLA